TLRLQPTDRPNKSIESRQLQHERHQANATGPHLDTHQVQREDQAMEERETGNTLEKRHDSGTGVQAVLIHAPCLQGATGDVQHLGRLALGEPLGVSFAISFKQLSALKARPALIAILIATVLVFAYRCHRLPPFSQSLPYEQWRAKDGEVAPWLQSLSVARPVFSRSPSRRGSRRGDRGQSV